MQTADKLSPENISEFFNSQLNEWNELYDGVNSLLRVKEKTIRFEKFSIKIQYNPRRIASTSAFVDANSIKNRKCFLCADNLPAKQKGFDYGQRFRFLCNPFPILREHFTVSANEHTPQQIASDFDSFLNISKEVSPRYSAFYNGPKCGASAPDHLHFQIGIGQDLPFFGELNCFNETNSFFLSDQESVVSIGNINMRSVVIIKSLCKTRIISVFEIVFKTLKVFLGIDEEPMMNIACFYNKGRWNLIVFLREKHRPKCFYYEGKEQFLVSPAVLDLCGCLVVPRMEDFERIDVRIIEKIFKEVSYPPGKIVAFEKVLRQRMIEEKL